MSAAHAARDQRDRHDEPVRGRVGAPGSPVRKVVVKSSTLVYGARQPGPVLVPRGRCRAPRPPRTPVERSARSRSRATSATSPTTTRTSTVTLLRFANVLGADIDTPLTPGARAAGRAVDLRLRPALAVRARGRRRPVDPVRARPTTCPASTTSPATGSCRGARWPRSAASAPRPCRRRHRARHLAAAPDRGAAARRAARPAAVRPRRRQPAAQGGRLPLPVHVGRGGRGLRRGLRLRETVGATEPTYRYERDVEKFFRHSPAVVRDLS